MTLEATGCMFLLLEHNDTILYPSGFSRDEVDLHDTQGRAKVRLNKEEELDDGV
jgi:hypothetical protein